MVTAISERPPGRGDAAQPHLDSCGTVSQGTRATAARPRAVSTEQARQLPRVSMKAVRSLSHRRSDDEREMDAAVRAQTKRQKCVPKPVGCDASHAAGSCVGFVLLPPKYSLRQHALVAPNIRLVG